MDEWRVLLDVEPADASALQAALPRIIPGERHALITGGWASEPDEAYLGITVVAATIEEAIEEASRLYRRGRDAAGLPDVKPQVLGYTSPVFAEPLYERLSQEASELMRQGRHALAVVRAQTAVEVYARLALEDLLRRRGGDVLVSSLLQQSTPALKAEPARGLLFLLTGVRIQEQEWWPAYVAHLKRRNGIVHEGWVVSDDDAEASLDVALKLRNFLEDLWAGAI